jgi:integrase
MLERFAKAFLHGTITVIDGKIVDDLGLYWRPRTQTSAKNGLSRLTEFLVSQKNDSDYWALAASPEHIDPLTGIRIAFRYVVQRNMSLLAHLSEGTTTPAPSHAFGGFFTKVSRNNTTYRFPAKYVWRFLFDGFKSTRSDEVDETAQLLAWVLFAGGCRSSEPLHAWVQDVQFIDGEPIMFIHDPRDGELYDASGHKRKRAEHLITRKRIPRNLLRKRGHSGFKGMEGEQLIWLPIDGLTDELSKRFRHYLAVTRPRIMRLRRAQGRPDHDYLFVGSGHNYADNTNVIGEPYTKEALVAAWERAVGRTSVLCDDPSLVFAKSRGTTPHGARHFYGCFLKSIECDGDLIMKCMHHRSPFSHLRYTRLSAREIDAVLQRKSKGPVDKRSMHATVTEALERQAARSRFH